MQPAAANTDATDDFIVLVRSAAEAAEALREVDTFLRNTLRLNLKEQKTQYVAVREGLTFVGFRFDGLSWTIPDESVVQVKEHLADVLREHRREMVLDAAKHHNDVVRGWRNYYGGNSKEMDRQLEDIECWRAGTVNAYFQSVGIDPIFGRGAFETFVAPLSASAPRGTYGDTRVASSAEHSAWSNDDLWHGGDSTAIAPVLQTHSPGASDTDRSIPADPHLRRLCDAPAIAPRRAAKETEPDQRTWTLPVPPLVLQRDFFFVYLRVFVSSWSM